MICRYFIQILKTDKKALKFAELFWKLRIYGKTKTLREGRPEQTWA